MSVSKYITYLFFFSLLLTYNQNTLGIMVPTFVTLLFYYNYPTIF